MPTVSVVKNDIFSLLGKEYTDEEFDELCFQFGLEIDDIVDDPDIGITYKIEVAANRYDLLCIEGIAQALNIFLGNIKLPEYSIVNALNPLQNKIFVKDSTKGVRPFIVGAVLRNLNFNKAVYDSFISLQEKLHQNLARKRSLVAIGTHDLDTITGPFVYEAKPPTDINFLPLNMTKNLSADILLRQLLHDSHLKEYVHLIKDKPLYPVIYDQNNVVLSLPPIINGNHTKITLDTKNIFIECTATDMFKAQIILDTLVCMFSGYCNNPFTVEPVQVVYADGTEITYPVLAKNQILVSVDYCNSIVGINENAASVANLLSKMCFIADVKNKEYINVTVPPVRYDILHECDIAEDFAIAYGFDKLAAEREIAPTNSIGQEFELNYLSDKIRLLLSQNNYTEAATFALCSKADMCEHMRTNLSDQPCVQVSNPKTVDCETVRISLLPGLLKTTASNKHISLPLRIFEVSDVVFKDSSIEKTRGVAARNVRHLCALNYHVHPGMEVVQGLLDNIMAALKIPSKIDSEYSGYYLIGKDHRSFFPGYCGRIIVNEKEVGIIGILHPEVITNFNLNNPASALELNLEMLFEIYKIVLK